MKSKNKILWIIITIIIISSYAILGYVIIKQQDKIRLLQKEDNVSKEEQINPELIANRKYEDNILIQNIKFESIETVDGNKQEQIDMELQNISDKKTENKWINIKFLDEQNNEVAVVPSRIYALEPGEKTGITIVSNREIKQAKNFILEETEPPANYVETNE